LATGLRQGYFHLDFDEEELVEQCGLQHDPTPLLAAEEQSFSR
jgi:hypothetical protein